MSLARRGSYNLGRRNSTGRINYGQLANVSRIIYGLATNPVGTVVGEAGKFAVNRIQKSFSGGGKKRKLAEMTPKGGVMYRSTARFAGKVRPNRRARRNRKGRRRAVAKVNTAGVSYQTEAVGQTTGDKCVYVGHSTALPSELLTLLCMVCMKKVMAESAITWSSWVQPRAVYINNGDVFQFVYKPTLVAANTAIGTSITVAAAQVTFADVALHLKSTVEATFVAGGLLDSMMLTEFQYIPSGGKLTKIDLQDVMIKYYFRSDMKIQNRSVANPGDDEIDVNNVPVFGKLYHGTGNGMLQRNVTNVKFLNGSAAINPISVDGSALPDFAEPPDASELTHVNKFTKFYIQPGNIKTSVLRFKTKINVTNLFIKLYRYYTNNIDNEWFNLGIFNIYGAERVIAKLPAEASPAITLTWQVDLRSSAVIYPSPQKYTTPYRVSQ